MPKTLGQFLKELRKLEHYSQEFVASYLNIIRQTYSHYETGRIIPPANSLYKLSQLYKVPIDRFFELSENSNHIVKKASNSIAKINPTMGSDKLTENELEMLFYYQQLDVDDRLDILDFLKIKCRRYKKI